MKKGLIDIDWSKIDKYKDSDITYFLFAEGKSIDTICRIRNLDRITVQNHIIDGKIKYRFLASSKDSKELLKSIGKAGKRDKIEVINSLDERNKEKLIRYIKDNYTDMYSKDKEVAIWILGELKRIDSLDVLMKASVHKFINIRRMAVSAMGKIENGKCEVALIRALEDENPQVVLYAIKALEKIKSIKAKEKLESLKKTSTKSYIREEVERYLKIIEK